MNNLNETYNTPKLIILQRYIFLLMLYATSLQLKGQFPMELRLTTQDGLPSNSVYRAIQDEEGIMWFCTEKGLAKFDGYEFTTFNTNNGLPHNDIFDIHLHDDKIWLSTFDSISYIKNEKVIGIKKPDELRAFSLYKYFFESDDMHLIYFPKAKKYYRIINDSLVLLELPLEERFLSIASEQNFTTNYYDPEENINYVRKYVNNKFEKKIPFQHDISDLKYENINIGERKYLFQKDSIFIWDGDFLKSYSYLDILGGTVDHYNIVEYKGIIVIYGKKNNYVLDKHLQILEGYDFLMDNDIRSFTIDDNNNFWTCGSEGVVFFLDKHVGCNSIKIKYKDDKYRSIIKDDQDNIYIATEDGRILEVTKKNRLVEKHAFDLSNVKDWQIDAQGKYCYILDKDVGIKKYNFSEKNSQEISFYEEDIEYSLKTFDLNKQGMMAIGYSYGLCLVKKDSLEKIFDKRTYGVKYQMDTLWIGTTQGLYKYYNNKEELVSLDVKEPYIKNIYLDDHNRIWAIPDRTGLYKIENGEYQNLSFLDDLYINRLRVDKNKNIWLATTNGLFFLDFDKNSNTYTRIKYGYSKGINSDNIADVEIVDNKVIAISDKVLYILDLDKRNKEKNTFFSFGKVEVNREDFSEKKLDNLHYTQNEIIVNYTCTSLDDFGKIQYQWKLEPTQNNWQSTKSRSLQFNSLAPNDYLLSIKTFDSNNELIHKEKSLAFTIRSPWYLTKWFLFLAAFIIIAAFLYYDQWRKNKEKKKIEIENVIQQQLYDLKLRAVRAQMNPHFIFNALNSIQKFIFLKSPEEANQYIVKFSKLMRMILESTNQSFTSLADEIYMLELYVSLEQLRFDNIFDYDIVVDPKLDRERTLIPSIMLQPFVENAINHGLAPRISKGKLSIRFYASNHNLICEIEDNGIGREESRKIRKSTHSSRALDIIKERKEILKESDNYIIDFIFEDLYNEKKESMGTKMILTLPLLLDYEQ